MHRSRLHILLSALILLGILLLAGCGDEPPAPPEISVHGQWTFGTSVGKSL